VDDSPAPEHKQLYMDGDIFLSAKSNQTSLNHLAISLLMMIYT